MSAVKPTIALFPGSTQTSRQIPALSPDYFQVDEQSLSQSLSRMVEVAQSFRFYNLDDQPEGTWGEFLLADPVFLAAVISQTDLSSEWPRAQALFEAALLAGPGQSDDYWQHFFELGWQQVRQLNHWFRQTEKLIHPGPLGKYLQQLIRTEAAPSWQALYDDYALLAAVWPSFENKLSSRMELAALWGFTALDRMADTNPLLSDAWWNNLLVQHKALLQLSQQVVDRAARFFEQALQHSDMSAQTGLILSFLGLVEYPKALLNDATRKHLDFYYRHVLGLHPEPPTAGCTWLTFTLPAESAPLLLPAGTSFEAGLRDEEGTPRYAASIKAHTLTAARFVRADLLQVPQVGSSISSFRLGPVSPEADSMKPISLGWAFSAPQLQLGSGMRTLHLRLTLKREQETPSSTDTFWEAVHYQGAQHWTHQTSEGLWDTLADRVPEMKVHTLLEGFWEPEQARYRPAVAEALEEVFPVLLPAGHQLTTEEARDVLAFAAMEHAQGRSNTFYAHAHALLLLHFTTEEVSQSVLALPHPQLLALLDAIWLGEEAMAGMDHLIQAQESGIPSSALHTWLVNRFQVMGTSPKQWHPLVSRATEGTEEGLFSNPDHLTLSFTLTHSPQDPPLSPFNAEVHTGNFASSWPILQFAIKPEATGVYCWLRGFSLQQVHLEQEVQRLQEVVFSNSEGEIDPSQPFPPFGADPLAGNAFLLDAPEFWIKPIREINLAWDWRSLPESFSNYYAAYNRHLPDSHTYHNEAFTATPAWHTGAGYAEQTNAQKVLFTEEEQALHSSAQCTFRPPNPENTPDLPEEPVPYFRWQLARDFGQTDWPAVTEAVAKANMEASLTESHKSMMDQTLKLVQQVWESTHPEAEESETQPEDDPDGQPPTLPVFPGVPDLPKPDPLPLEPQPQAPYVPMAEKVSVGYRSTQTWDLTQPQADIQCYHLGPWTEQPWPEEIPTWLPPFAHPEYVYLGAQPFAAGDRVSVLAQVHHELSNWDAHSQVIPLHLEYYATCHAWKRLAVSEDYTLGLLTSGIFVFETPEDLAAGCPDFPPVEGEDKVPVGYLRWLLPTHLPQLRIEYVHTQAIEVVDTLPGLPSLAAGTIQVPVKEWAELESIHQPIPSKPGKAPASALQYWQQAANRLQHKQRAGRLQDLEALALEAFPELYMARAIPQPQGGGVSLVVANQTTLSSRSPWVPRVPGLLLKQLYEYLLPLLPPGVSLQVTHPAWEYLDVEGYVEWEKGTQEAGALAQIRQQLRQYLAPWLEAAGSPNLSPTVQGVYQFLKAQPQVRNVHQLTFFRHQPESGERVLLANGLTPTNATGLLIPGSLLETDPTA
ncbi:MAG: hypothetical protein AAFQ98_14725 [Bacteroidota bacterium]